MAAETKIRVAGVWKLITQPEVRVSGSWKEVQEIEIKVSGAWKRVFLKTCIVGSYSPGLPAFLDDLEDEPTPALGGAQWHPNGGVYFYDGSTTPETGFPGTANGGTWIGNCPAEDYEGRWVEVSGIGPGDSPDVSEPAINVWRAMDQSNGVSLEWSKATGVADGIFAFELRRTSDSGVILTDPVDFCFESEDPTPK